MNWTEPSKATPEIPYDHVTCETPLGLAIICWKGWKFSDSFSVEVGDTYVDVGVDLDDAKRIAKGYLIGKFTELGDFLGFSL